MTGSTRDPAFSPQVSHAGWVSPHLLFFPPPLPVMSFWPVGTSSALHWLPGFDVCRYFSYAGQVASLCEAFDSAMGKAEVVQRNQEQVVLGQTP